MTYTQEEIAYLWFDSFFDGYVKMKYDLLDAAESALDFALNLDKFSSFLIKSEKIDVYNSMKESLKDNSYCKGLVRKLEKEGVVAVTKASAYYPPELLSLSDAPAVLYCKGNLELLKEKKFAIVGSRRTQANILKLTEKTSQELSEHFVVVTGIADGGDGAAIQGALDNGKIISVLPCGHDQISPAAMWPVYEDICASGLCISEYPLGMRAQKFTYPPRNRLIAGLSIGVLAVSAGEKSGVLSTAYRAVDYGREVFAFPYYPGVESGVGCNALIKNGAFLCENTVDILTHFGIDLKIQQEPSLTEGQKTIVALLKDGEGMHLYELAEKTGMDVNELSMELLFLEMEGLVVKIGGNRYSAV